MSDKAPSDASAVAFQGVLRVVYVDQAGILKYVGADNKQDEADDVNKTFGIFLDNSKEPVSAREVDPRIASVAWKNPTDEWRVYYVDRNNMLAELVKSGDSNWSLGSLGRSKVSVAPKSALAAGVDDDGVRLYFQRSDLGTLMTMFSSKSQKTGPKWSAPTEAAVLF